MKKYILKIFLLLLLTTPSLALTQQGTKSENKDLMTLLEEAENLFMGSHPIDARAKLQEAIKSFPKDYRAYLRLGQYYLSDIGHFKLAYRFIKTSEEKFEAEFGSDKNNSLNPLYQNQHAIVLYMLSEAELNLDKYEDSLNTLERFEKNYWMNWLPGSKAWVLMKMGKISEAIRVSKRGIIEGAEPRRTWNILGILLSMQGQREQSLKAFRQAIISEMMTSRQASTPLNNSGEVYRELFRDAEAELAWIKALEMSDGCEHVLPSLNLSHSYIEQLRLFQAERVLNDFESCFNQSSDKEDSEHRTLLALARGKIALRKNDIKTAKKLFQTALADQQWFGKIGTNENDVKLASLVSSAELLSAQANANKDIYYSNYSKLIFSKFDNIKKRFLAFWNRRLARKLASQEMNNFEDLYTRHTDAMLEYPTLGNLLKGFNTSALEKRFKNLKLKDNREQASHQYNAYLGINYFHNYKYKKAYNVLSRSFNNFREFDRFQKAETLAYKIRAFKKLKFFLSKQDKEIVKSETELLFSLLPSQVRFHNLSLPVRIINDKSKYSKKALKHLLSKRFNNKNKNAKYQLSATTNGDKLSLQLLDLTNNQIIANKSEETKDFEKLVNAFIQEAFSHKTDPPQLNLPGNISVMEGVR